MDERVLPPTPGAIAMAVEALRAGELVAFPTETVYGLGADARQEAAVRRVFEVKGRPPDHPLIVHLHDAGAMAEWARDIPDAAWRLAQELWPGPLTLILHRQRGVHDVVTGGQDTIGLRVPAHPLALTLLRESGCALAAPSANRFGRVSPTTARHVRDDLGGDVRWILDGGSCRVGVESTIVDLTGDEPAILRPGGVEPMLIELALRQNVPVRPTGVRASGTLEAHYAPRARVEALPSEAIPARLAALQEQGVRVQIIAPSAELLYALLRQADDDGAEVILAPLLPEMGIGIAVNDRLRRAAAASR